MSRHFLLLFIRVCAVVLPLVAVHRFWIAATPGYKQPEQHGNRSTVRHENEAMFSMAWRIRTAELDLRDAQAEAKALAREIEIARFAASTAE